jgi:hypothetical protein
MCVQTHGRTDTSSSLILFSSPSCNDPKPILVFISWRLDAVTISTGHAAPANPRVYVPWSRHEIKPVIRRSGGLHLLLEHIRIRFMVTGGVLLNRSLHVYLTLFNLCFHQSHTRKIFYAMPYIENNPNTPFCLAVNLLYEGDW